MTFQMSWIDWLIIIIYFGFVIGIGYYLKRFTKTGDDFFMAGRKNSAWVAGLAFLSANLGSLEILGWTGGTMKYGMFVSHFYWIGAVPAMLFLGLYMMPFYYSSKIHSIPGYLKLRFDEKTRLLNAASFGIMTILMSGINLYLMALVFNVVLKWDLHVSIWISAGVIAVYITLGGLLSAIFTEIVQFFLIWFGLFLVSILGLIELGGLKAVLTGLPERLSALWSTAASPTANEMGVTWLGIVLGLGFVLSFGYWTTDFLLVQRAFSAKDLDAARKTPIFASFFKMALPLIVVGSGLVAWKLQDMGQITLLAHPYTGEPWNDTALPVLIARYFPAGLIGLGITALLAGFMAGQAGNVSAFNTVWTYDIYRVLFKKDASDAHLVVVGRITTIVGIFLSILTAYAAMRFNTIMDYIQAIFSWVNAPLFATMLLGMFWARTTPAGAFWGLIAGMGSSFLMFIGIKFHWLNPAWLTFSQNPSDMSHNLWRAWWAWLICFVLTIIISLFTKPKPKEELVGLVKGLTPAPTVTGQKLLQRPAVVAVISFIVFVVLNIIFW
ncbi:MAG: sodium:solute symporter family protein [candidate division KSB1 bacterium]|nr:sodium:solute symporter family protein [candidate division KSB1 bacterium]MDZ7334138.1 sodium:solute symporter family protein [candidate division KSB1 bacterium]MDZ7357386.1 sodium:solute symporter family protein [candidate division KSB1 bacterium]MDZ7401366.1 sodium:solute symporter family protein [candidate division KSB1 bacterium]